MKIETADGHRIDSVTLFLTVAEAGELRDSVEALLEANDTERHEHVPSADFQTEITLTIERT